MATSLFLPPVESVTVAIAGDDADARKPCRLLQAQRRPPGASQPATPHPSQVRLLDLPGGEDDQRVLSVLLLAFGIMIYLYERFEQSVLLYHLCG